MMRFTWLFLGAGALGALAGCTVYSANLVGTGGAGGAGPSGSSAGNGGATSTSAASSTTSNGSTTGPSSSGSGGMSCTGASDCPGTDTDCQKRSCAGGVCGVDFTMTGTAITKQTAGDCTKVVCDGAGNQNPVADDSDAPADKKDCMVRGCDMGMPTALPAATGAACMQGTGKVCTSASKCVQCLSAVDCTGGFFCNPMNVCVAPQCNDVMKNGAESDVDCGGGTCPKCGPGKICNSNADCASATCTGGTCAVSCNDLVKDGSETDVDCGGSCSTKCATGKACAADADCQSGKCTSNVCADVLLISQVQSRGDAGGNDEFVELYNPTSIPVTFDASWTLKARSAIGGVASCATNALAVRFTGAGQVIPPHGHLLYVNTTVPAYNGLTPGDGTYATGIPDAASVVLLHGNNIIDALCFYFDTTTQGALTGCSAAYTCEGTPLMNPHDNLSATNFDASFERKPGGSGGNMTDSGNNANDFTVNMTPDPRDLASAPVP